LIPIHIPQSQTRTIVRHRIGQERITCQDVFEINTCRSGIKSLESGG